jgi:RHS repeat-associated protein
MKYTCYALLLFGLLVTSNETKAQHQVRVDFLVDQTATYEAQNSVKFLPGAECTPSLGETIIGRINKSLSVVASDQFNIWESLPTQNRPFDINLGVGGLKGVAGVNDLGQATYSIPIVLPPGIKNLKPELSIEYNSSGGPGNLGRGWSAGAVSQISRVGKTYRVDQTSTSVNFTSDDRFALDGNRLVISSGTYGANGQVYDTELKQFMKITSYGQVGSGPERFLVETKDGGKLFYGYTSDSRQVVPNTNEIIGWHLNRVEDRNGNFIEYHYEYDQLTGETLLREISYTGNQNTGQASTNHIFFGYQALYYSNLFFQNTVFLPNGSIQSSHLLNRIEVYENSNLISAYGFRFSNEAPEDRLVGIDFTNADNKSTNPIQIFYNKQSLENAEFMAQETNFNFTGSNKFVAGDYNGDGRTDIIRLPPSSSYEQKWRCFISNANGTFTDWDNAPTVGGEGYALDINNDGYTDFINCYNSKADVWVGSSNGMTLAQSFTLSWPAVDQAFVTDFDGNGLPELFLNLSPTDRFELIEFSSTSGYTSSTVTFQYDRNSGNKLIPLDFNGNGKTDLLRTNNSNSEILERNSGAFAAIYSGSYPTKDHQIYVGDFNGEGKSDILTFRNSDWIVGFSDGVQFIQDNQGYIFDEFDKSNLGTGHADNDIFVVDIDGNGKSDVIQWHNEWNGSIADENTVRVVLNNGVEDGPHYFAHTNSGSKPRSEIINLVDFNGDGHIEIFWKREVTENGKKIEFYDNNEELVVSKILDGFDNEVSFQYGLLTNSSIYSRTSSSVPELFFKSVTSPFRVVKELHSPNADGSKSKLTYTFQNALYHAQGKGFMGFLKVEEKHCSTLNNCNGNRIVKSYDYSHSNAFPHSWLSNLKTYNSQNTLISESVIDVNMFTTPILGNLSYFPYHEKETQIDHLNAITSETDYVYNSTSGNLSSSSTSVNGVYFESRTYSYGTVNSWIENALLSTTTTLTEQGSQQSFSATEEYTYFSNGNLKTKVEYAGEPKAVTSSFKYDSFGNLTQFTLSSAGEESRISTNTYSGDGRFLISSTNPFGHEVSFDYDSRWGQVNRSSFQGVVSETSVYDAYGTVKESTLENVSVAKERQFYTSSGAPLGTFYFEKVSYENGVMPTEYVYYDKKGRQLRRVYEGFSGPVFSDTEYDNLGRILKESSPYYSSDQPEWTTYTYDAFNRVSSISTPNSGSYSYSYDTRKVLVSNDQTGQYTEREFDILGRPIVITKDGESTFISYHINGQVETIEGANNSEVTYQYDQYGNQISFTDSDVGEVSYEYDAFGNVITQIQGSSVFETEYDKLGRPSSRTSPEGVYQYVYNGLSGLATGALVKVIAPSGDYEEFSHDALGNVVSKQSYINGNSYTFTFEHDILGRVSKMVYPSGFSVKNNYNDQGYLSEVINTQDNTVLWKANAVNALGQIEDQQFGNGLQSTNEYDSNHQLERITTGSIQDFAYTINPYSGNLEERSDLLRGITEVFGFTQLDQLELVNQSGGGTYNVEYKNGAQISLRSEVGEYSYTQQGSRLRYVVPDVDNNNNPLSSIPTITQELTFTSFNKIKTINEGDLEATFEYGPMEERVSMEVKDGGKLVRNVTYLGPQEVIEKPDGVSNVHYVLGGDGIVAVIVNDNESTDYQTYYVHKDHLGSWTHITDEQADLVEENSFDAWGRRRNADDWTYDNLSNEHLFARGYTGHEHLDDPFNVINMNGRIYDPLVGMMMSADNYIPEIGNPNSHNRYAYAHNNPLKYTDPSGDSPLLAAVGLISLTWNIMKLGNASLQALQGNNSPQIKGQFLSAGIGIAGFGKASGNIAGAIVSETAPIYQKALAQIGANALVSGALAHSAGGSFGSGLLNGSVYGAFSYSTTSLGEDIRFARAMKSTVMLEDMVMIVERGRGILDGGADALSANILRSMNPYIAAIHHGHDIFILETLENPGVTMLMFAVPVAEVAALTLNLLKVGIGQAAKAGLKQGIRQSAKAGIEGELAVGIKSTGKVAIESLTKTAVRRYPDKLLAKVLIEVKNVKSLSFTNQLKDFALYAQKTGRVMELYVRPSTKLSGPLKKAIKDGLITLKHIPGTF